MGQPDLQQLKWVKPWNKIVHHHQHQHHVKFMELKNETGEIVLLADEEQVTEPDNSIGTDDLPSTTTANSDEHQDPFMVIYQAKIIKLPTIPYEEARSTWVGWKTKAN